MCVSTVNGALRIGCSSFVMWPIPLDFALLENLFFGRFSSKDAKSWTENLHFYA